VLVKRHGALVIFDSKLLFIPHALHRCAIALVPNPSLIIAFGAAGCSKSWLRHLRVWLSAPQDARIGASSMSTFSCPVDNGRARRCRLLRFVRRLRWGIKSTWEWSAQCAIIDSVSVGFLDGSLQSHPKGGYCALRLRRPLAILSYPWMLVVMWQYASRSQGRTSERCHVVAPSCLRI
jgi:hypothetical protein